ncbi:MAG: rRNA maturation RNase YbeY [Paludibacteraceae bacterium]|nr:rRNA maturation RNase YbeY [Paludibacteraceae bacterium]
MITYQNDPSIPRVPRFPRRTTSKWIAEVAHLHGKKIGEVAYIFCSDEKILKVNRQYLQHDYYTDIITFDYTEGDVLNGDIFISTETVRSNAESYGTTFEEELRRIVIHGILHLCGQEDKQPDDRREMTRQEDEALGLFPTAGRER